MSAIFRNRRPRHRLRHWLGVGVVCLGFLPGCLPGDRTEIPRTEVQGQVFLDGKPLTSGVIEFESVEAAIVDASEDVDSPSVVAFATVNEGNYHIKAGQGPAVGVNQVRVRPAPLPREQLEAILDVRSTSRRRPQPLVVQEIHPGYGTDSPLRAELQAEQVNIHDLRLQSGGP